MSSGGPRRTLRFGLRAKGAKRRKALSGRGVAVAADGPLPTRGRPQRARERGGMPGPLRRRAEATRRTARAGFTETRAWRSCAFARRGRELPRWLGPSSSGSREICSSLDTLQRSRTVTSTYYHIMSLNSLVIISLRCGRTGLHRRAPSAINSSLGRTNPLCLLEKLLEVVRGRAGWVTAQVKPRVRCFVWRPNGVHHHARDVGPRHRHGALIRD